jgi:hypothetical protein
MKGHMTDNSYKAASTVLIERGIKEMPPYNPSKKGEIITGIVVTLSGLFFMMALLYLFGFSLSKDRGYETIMGSFFLFLGFVTFGIAKFYAKKKGVDFDFYKKNRII